MGQVEPAGPLSDLAGRFIVLTGANTGIGRATALALAARGASLALAGRSAARTQPVLDAIRAVGGDARFFLLDLADLAAVRRCAEQLRAHGRPIDVLINNAGIASQRGLTTDGFELAFGTNHLGHFLLTVLLADRLRAAAPSRIVNLTSTSHYEVARIDYDAVRAPTRTFTGLHEYAISKLANVLFTRELARRLGPSGVHSYAVHPGVVASDIWRRVPWPVRATMKRFMISNEEGAATALYCATSQAVADHDGRYYDRCREGTPNPVVEDAALAGLLWTRSVRFAGADL